MKIHVNILSLAKTISLDVEQTDSIYRVKEMIHDKEGISPLQQTLMLERKQLEEFCTISDYNIVQRKTTLTLRLSSDIRIHFKTCYGKTITLEINGNYTTHYIKQKIEEKEKIPTLRQTLFFDGEQLGDECSVFSSGIHYDSNVNLKLSLGCSFHHLHQNFDL